MLCTRWNSVYRGVRSEGMVFFFFQAEDGIRDLTVTGVQTCALPISIVDLRRSGCIARLVRDAPARFCRGQRSGASLERRADAIRFRNDDDKSRVSFSRQRSNLAGSQFANLSGPGTKSRGARTDLSKHRFSSDLPRAAAALLVTRFFSRWNLEW